MRRNRWALVCVALALAVPLPANALTAGSDEAPPATLTVAASLDGCGLAGTHIVCRLGVSFNAIPDATRYTASVTRPDGSVIDYGAIASGGSAVHVPYVGSGTYNVRVSAYGWRDDDEHGEPVLLDTDSANARPTETDRPGARETDSPGQSAPTAAGQPKKAGGGQSGVAADSAQAAAVETQPGSAPCAAAPADDPPVEPPAVGPTAGLRVEESAGAAETDELDQGGRDEQDADDDAEPAPPVAPEEPPVAPPPVADPPACPAK
jgi:hypothetical protein